jgi:translation initiation factor 1
MGKKDRNEDKTTTRAPEPRDSPFAVLAGLDVPLASPGVPPVDEPAAPPARPPGKPRGRLVLRRETKHRGGKAVVVVSGFGALAGFDEAAVEALAAQLKRRLGCGGTVEARDGDLELVLQGDRAAAVAASLRELGYRVDGVTG